MMLPILAMALLAPPVVAPATTFEIFPGDGAHGREADHVHDPTLVQIGGKEFVFSTSGDGFTVVRESTDLVNWKVLGPILKSQPEWLAKRYDHKSIWAPDVLVLGKKVRVYYSASNFGTNLSVIGLAENPSFDPARPLEGWVDRGLVIETKPGDVTNAIDAETFVDPGGRHWMVYGSYWAGIHGVELDPGTGLLKNPSDPKPICLARNTAERGNPLEGAAVLRRGGYYYLFVSYGLAAQGIRSTYRIMVGRSKEPMGPYVDREGKSMVDGGHLNVLKTSPPMVSPGHCDVLTLADGRTVMPYHFYDARQAWFGDNWGMPTLQVRELLWDAEGWPLPGLPLEAPRPVGGSSPVGRWWHQADFGQPMEIRLAADGSIQGGRLAGRWERTGDRLTLTWTPEASSPSQKPFVDQVQLAYGNGFYVGRNAEGRVIRGVRRPDGS